MKNTTFRKKALLSSVAMLLVALVALGSATFAWFTTNPTVNANGLSLEATAAAGLQILSSTTETAGGTWDVSTVINAVKGADNKIVTDSENVVLNTPVSLDCSVTNAVTFRTTQAAIETSYEKDTAAAISTASAGYTETLKLRSSVDNGETVTVGSAKVTMEAASGNDAATKLYPALRVTLVDSANNAVIGTWSSDGVANKYLTATAISTTDYTNAKANGAVATMNKAVGYNDGSAVIMYVWLDGEDDACCTANVETLKQLVKTINVQFSVVE